MEVSGIISSRPSLFSGVLSSRQTSSSMFVPPPSGFSDTGHLQFYCSGLKLKAVSTRCGVAVKENDSASKKNMKILKKRLKLLKGLSKDITFLSEMEIVSNSNFQQDQDQDDHSSMDIIDGRKLSEATELLMGQLKQLKAAEKEVKMNKKKEKAKLKAARKQNLLLLGCEDSSSSSSSESSGDEHPRQVMDMSRLKKALAEGRSLNTELQSPPPHQQVAIGCLPENKINLISSSSSSLMEAITPAKIETDVQPETKMIEVCMGSKCKKLGAAALMEEFQKSVGVEIAVVGCKCMGKCRSAPNVKVHDVEQRLLVSSAADQEGEEIEKRNRSPLLCTGVELNDVSLIVSNI